MISLIPAFYTNGQFKNKYQLYNKGQLEFNDANKYQTAMNVTRIISIGCGLFWGYELVRYLLAANSVLPQKAKKGSPSDFLLEDKIDERDISDKNIIDDGEKE